MLEATVKSLSIKIATCPHCSRQRPYYLDDEDAPIPLVIPFYNGNYELREIKINYDPGNLISSFVNKSTFVDSSATYSDNELVDRKIEIIDGELNILERHTVKSNTKDTITIVNKFSGQRFYKQYQDNKPFYRFKDVEPMDFSKAKKNLYSLNVFNCECGNKYTVEKV
jgi:hypothetical protein